MKHRKQANRHVITLSETFYLGLGLMILMTAVIMVLFYYVKQAGKNAYNPKRQAAIVIEQLRNMGDDDYAYLDALNDPDRGIYFDIFDPDGNEIFSASPDNRSSGDLSAEVLRWIPDSLDRTAFQIVSFEQNGETYYTVIQHAERDDEKELQNIFIFDHSGNLQFESTSSSQYQTAEEYYQFVRNNVGELIQKFQFTNGDGQQRYLVVHINMEKSTKDIKPNRLTLLYHTCLALILFTALLVTSLLIGHRVKDPILALQNAVQKFSENHQRIDVKSYGPAEIRALTDAFNQMSAAIENKEKEQEKLRRQKDEMLTDISHDLKTPITIVNGYIHALDDGLIAPEDQKKYFRIIAGEADVLSGLIDSFSDYSRLNRAEYPINAAPKDLGEFVRGFFAERYEALQIINCNVRVNIPEKEMIVNFDERLMQRALENMFTNSLKHRNQEITLIADMWETDDTAYLFFGDTGEGISDALREDIFEPFVMGDRSRAGGKSSGLGLSIVKKIIELHGGTITLLTRDETRILVMTGQIQDVPSQGFGACFLIKLPLAEYKTANIKKH